jgi:hypothetical protein
MPSNCFSSSHLGTAHTLRSFSDKAGEKKGGENLQHEAWVQFQQNIAVDGFDTGAVTTFNDASGGVKRRGGKALRKRMERLRLRREEAASITEVSRLNVIQFIAVGTLNSKIIIQPRSTRMRRLRRL